MARVTTLAVATIALFLEYGSGSTAAIACYFRVWPGTRAFSHLMVKSQVTG